MIAPTLPMPFYAALDQVQVPMFRPDPVPVVVPRQDGSPISSDETIKTS